MPAEGCRWIEPAFIEDDDENWEAICKQMDRFGDRLIPRDPNWDLANRDK